MAGGEGPGDQAEAWAEPESDYVGVGLWLLLVNRHRCASIP